MSCFNLPPFFFTCFPPLTILNADTGGTYEFCAIVMYTPPPHPFFFLKIKPLYQVHQGVSLHELPYAIQWDIPLSQFFYTVVYDRKAGSRKINFLGDLPFQGILFFHLPPIQNLYSVSCFTLLYSVVLHHQLGIKNIQPLFSSCMVVFHCTVQIQISKKTIINNVR